MVEIEIIERFPGSFLFRYKKRNGAWSAFEYLEYFTGRELVGCYPSTLTQLPNGAAYVR